ncbi:MAG: hypothetical protein M3O87_00705 [Candidatus Dormibacteraeota bacterium]|nr:hypothetical protein [Candidatus Dormibacteraeota bacterium]
MGWACVAFLPIPGNDVDAFFWPSAREALNGQPLQIYHPLGQAQYPNANGPLAILPLVLIGSLLRAIGAMESMYLRRAVILFFFSLFVLLMSREALATVEWLRGGRLSRFTRALAFAAFAFAPAVFQGLGGYGHIEQALEIWLTLLAARWVASNRPARAGVALGLAVLARSSAALLALPLGVAALRRGPLRLAILGLLTAVTTVAGLLPFLLADRAAVVRSLVTYRAALPIGAGSIWSWSRGTPMEAIGQNWDALFILGLSVALNLWLARWRREQAGPERLYAALALTSASFCLLAKTVWPYYLVEVYVFTAVWTFAHRGAPQGRLWRVIPLLAPTALALLAESGATANLSAGLVKFEGLTMFLLLGASMLWLAIVAARPGGADVRRP